MGDDVSANPAPHSANSDVRTHTYSWELPHANHDVILPSAVGATAALPPHEHGITTMTSMYSTSAADGGYSVQYEGHGDADATEDSPDDDACPFHWAIGLPASWCTRDGGGGGDGDGGPGVQELTLCMRSLSRIDDCVYQIGLYVHKNDAWKIVQRLGAFDKICADGEDASVYRVVLPNWATQNASSLFLGFTRVDFGEVAQAHALLLREMRLTTCARDAEGACALAESDRLSLALAKINKLEQLQDPIAVVNSNIFPVGDECVLLELVIDGSAQGVQSMMLSLVPVTDGGECSPLCTPLHVQSDAKRFSGTVRQILSTLGVERIDVYLHAQPLASSTKKRKIAITVDAVNIAHHPISAGRAHNADAGEHEHLFDIGEINATKHKLQNLNDNLNELQRKPGPEGARGARGPKGERGDCFRFADLTDPQRESLRGKRGACGSRGEPLRFEHLTEYQRKLITGPIGERGAQGNVGATGEQGPSGKALRFEDLAPKQREAIRGEQGPRGQRGEAFCFEDYTSDQLEMLRGPVGIRGETGDKGERGDRGRIGPTGPVGPEGKQGPRGLPGIPGESGKTGAQGEQGNDGQDGRCAVIKTNFASVELLRKFITKSQHVPSNSYYIVNNEEEAEHGNLYVYTGMIVYEVTIGCMYPDNIVGILGNYEATLDSKIRIGNDEWKMRISIQSHLTCVYQLASALLKTIQQGGYPVKESNIIDDAIALVGTLCGPGGRRGPRGHIGPEGATMLGMRIDYIGDEAQRLQTEPESNTIFLQVSESKQNCAGFYLYNHHQNTWTMLHGIELDAEFTRWMQNFVQNPDNDSVPLALSLFSTTQKHIEASFKTLREEFGNYRDSNDKWKKYQFEQFKTLGNSQYQRLNEQIIEIHKELEGNFTRSSDREELSSSRDDLALLRKSFDRQHLKVEKTVHQLRMTLTDLSEHTATDHKSRDKQQEQIQIKMKEFDTSLIKILKLIQYLKTTPWAKSIKILKHDVDRLTGELHTTRSALEKEADERQEKAASERKELCTQLSDLDSQLQVSIANASKTDTELQKVGGVAKKSQQQIQFYFEKEFPEQLRGVRDELAACGDRMNTQELRAEQRLTEHNDHVDKRLLQLSNDTGDRVGRVQKELQGKVNKQNTDLLTHVSKENYLLKQELIESANDLRELIGNTEQKLQSTDRSFDKQLQDMEHNLCTTTKKQLSQFELSTRDLLSELHLAHDNTEQRLDKADKRHLENTSELAQLHEVVQKKVETSELKIMEHVERNRHSYANDINKRLVQLDEKQTALTKGVEKGGGEALDDVKHLLAEAQSSCADNNVQLVQQLDAVRGKLQEQFENALARVHSKQEKNYSDLGNKYSELVDDINAQIKNARAELSTSTKGVHKLIHDNDHKLVTSLHDCRQTLCDRIEEKIRETDAKYHSTFQSITGDISNLDNKCNTIDYLLKARLESIEEHIQQLFAEGQQQCTDIIAKHKKELTGTFESVRNDLVQTLKKNTGALNDQLTRSDNNVHKLLADHAQRIDTASQMQNTQRKDFALMQREFNDIERRLQKEHQRIIQEVSDQTNANKQRIVELKAHITNIVADAKQTLHAEVKGLLESTIQTTWKTQLTELETRITNLHQTKMTAVQSKMSALCSNVESLSTQMQDVCRSEEQYQANHKERFNDVVTKIEQAFVEIIGDKQPHY